MEKPMMRIDVDNERMLFNNDLNEYKMSEQGKLVRMALESNSPNHYDLHKAIERYYTDRNSDRLVYIDSNREIGKQRDKDLIEMIRKNRSYSGY